jgi:hypothetical protein
MPRMRVKRALNSVSAATDLDFLSVERISGSHLPGYAFSKGAQAPFLYARHACALEKLPGKPHLKSA